MFPKVLHDAGNPLVNPVPAGFGWHSRQQLQRLLRLQAVQQICSEALVHQHQRQDSITFRRCRLLCLGEEQTFCKQPVCSFLVAIFVFPRGTVRPILLEHLHPPLYRTHLVLTPSAHLRQRLHRIHLVLTPSVHPCPHQHLTLLV
jgi:hypothetical protein